MKDKRIEFIEKSGGCIVSKNILTGKGNLKWMVREKSINKDDNGWRFFSDIDDNVFLSDSNNLEICDFNTVANIEPAVLGIYLLPEGSDLQLVVDNEKRKFFDNLLGEEVFPIYK